MQYIVIIIITQILVHSEKIIKNMYDNDIKIWNEYYPNGYYSQPI